MAIKEAILPEYDHEMGVTRKLLARVPPDALSWKPHEKSRTMGRLAKHLAEIPQWARTILNDTAFDLVTLPGPDQTAAEPTGQPQAVAEILATFDANVATLRDALASTSDAEYMAVWMLKRGGHELFTLPRIAALRSFLMNHIIHHRGQLSVYLRVNNIPVPAIYGPSADEGF